MPINQELEILANYLTGEFENRQQALDEPIWYVHLRLWQVPVPLFVEDSITFFLEQASVVELHRPYRQRIMRLRGNGSPDAPITAQYYQLKDPVAVMGGGSNPKLLDNLTSNSITALPGCLLNITVSQTGAHNYQFSARQPPGCQCSFTYASKTVYVALGFDAKANELKTYDRGIDPTTGKATWGAIMGPYCYAKLK